MKNTILKNGLFGGLTASSCMAAMTLYMKSNPSYEPNMALGFGCMLVAYMFLFLGIKQERDADNGLISFRKAFKTGLLIALVISTIYVAVWLVIYYNFFPDFIEQYSELMLKNAKPEELAAKTTEMNQMREWYKNPVMIILLTFMEILPFGILVSLLAALVMKKK
jgi:Protein of unknown function (DUF4199)